MAKVISVISGKGGTGKTFFSISLADALAKSHKTILLDFNFPHPNAYAYLDKNNNLNCLNHVLAKQVKMKDAVYKHKTGFYIMPSSIFLKDLIDLDLDGSNLKKIISELSKIFEFIVIDTAPGISDISKLALKNSTESVLVTTPNYVDVLDNLKMIEFARTVKNRPLGFVVNKHDEFSKKADERSMVSFFNLPCLGKIPYLRSNEIDYMLNKYSYKKLRHEITDNVKRLL